MTAIETIKQRRVRDKEWEVIADRLALEQALREELGDDGWAEVRVEYTAESGGATVHVAGHAAILVHMQVDATGVGWELDFSVHGGDLKSSRFFPSIADALLYAEYLELKRKDPSVRCLRWL